MVTKVSSKVWLFLKRLWLIIYHPRKAAKEIILKNYYLGAIIIFFVPFCINAFINFAFGYAVQGIINIISNILTNAILFAIMIVSLKNIGYLLDGKAGYRTLIILILWAWAPFMCFPDLYLINVGMFLFYPSIILLMIPSWPILWTVVFFLFFILYYRTIILFIAEAQNFSKKRAVANVLLALVLSWIIASMGAFLLSPFVQKS